MKKVIFTETHTFILNDKPKGGKSNVDPKTGTGLVTDFKITSSEWTDGTTSVDKLK